MQMNEPVFATCRNKDASKRLGYLMSLVQAELRLISGGDAMKERVARRAFLEGMGE